MKTEIPTLFEEGTNGRGVLLIHGLTGAPAEMRLVARHLNRRGYSVFAPLLAGHGMDAAALRRSRWEDWLESVHEARAGFSKRVDTVYAAGICVGGKLAMMAAADSPGKIEATAIYSPCFHYDGWEVPHRYSLLSPHLRWISHLPLLGRMNFRENASLGIKDERMRRLIAGMGNDGMLESFPGKALFEMHELGRTLKSRLPSMKTPTLIIHSREDDLSGPSHATYIADHIGGRNRLHWLDDSYHMIHVDRQRRVVADLTADFFETDDAAKS
ncbi:alpha/beta hydrolase [Agrobacterium sp. rho-13.3]|uniref:alpha/beta hydrolase n=1 Tax=Agrobacterium sp. rho-13.3 TaxID=3072980 RepID=UPI002A0ED7F9|nr:alpha/beta fold hydrolase [Agrobacterium sp. rho-13.3]MDX8308111.1 alpha/beta fold hydrolase [Agrobacterium sp. rho-13.3]